MILREDSRKIIFKVGDFGFGGALLYRMKFTFIAVLVPALQQILAFEQKYKKECQVHDIEITCFFVAGMEQWYQADPQILIDTVAGADIAVVDTMGASEALQEIVRQGLEQYGGA